MPTSRFNTYLRGLLGLLDAKVQGKAPEQFDDTMRVTLGAEPFVYAQTRSTLTDATDANITIPGRYIFNGTLVPADEVWLVKQAGWVLNDQMGATENFQASLGLLVRQGVLGIFADMPLPCGQLPVFTNLDMPGGAVHGEFVMTPGDRMMMFVHRSVTGTNLGSPLLTLQFSVARI
jgi:hypothetical protein